MWRDRQYKSMGSAGFASRELDTRHLEQNGARRNLLRFYLEHVWAWRNTKDARHRLGFNADLPHDAMNVVAEYTRHAPFSVAHYFVFYVLVTVPLIAWLST